MSEGLLAYVIIFAGIGALLPFLLFFAFIYLFKKNKREGNTTKDLMSYIKQLLANKREDPGNLLNEKMLRKTEVKASKLKEDERQLYQHLIKLSVNKDTRLLKSATTGIHSIIGKYIKLISVQSEALALAENSDAGSEKSSKSLMVKKENEALRNEVSELETKLKNATDTIEDMMGEFSSMYEGGKEERENRTEKEMKKIKKKINSE